MNDINTEVLRKGYQAFFTKSEAGKHFVDTLQEMIKSDHEKAEDKPDLARDYAQRAKGVREVESHIKSVIAERGQPK